MSQEKQIRLPIDKLSYSALTQLLRNPLIFKLKYVLGVYDSKASVSAMIGRAGHQALKFYYGGMPELPVPADHTERMADAIKIGMDFLLNTDDLYIKYGKTGSREEMLKGYTTAMQIYFEEEPQYHEIVACEERMEAEIKNHQGQVFPLPAVGVPDIIEKRKDGKYQIIDTKFVKSFTPYENEDGEPHEDYIKIIQAKFLDYLLTSTKGIRAEQVIFREIKRSKNKDARQPQIRDYVVPLNHEPYDIIFVNLYADVVKFISNPDSIYLPNLGDNMDGEQAGLLYAQGLLSADMSDVEVMHKVKDVAFTSKKFISSKVEQVQNKNLLPEEKIKLRLAEFGIPVEPVEVKIGANIIQYQFKVSAGISMGRFKKHELDIARAIEAKSGIKIVAPIPGTSLVGVEVPAEERKIVLLEKKHLTPNTLELPLGVDIHDKVYKLPLNEMPHLLIAGATNSGKSVLLHSIILALSKQMKPEDMDMVLIDPKRVELVAFKKLPHLVKKKIIYETEEATAVLRMLVLEMEARYKKLEENSCRNIDEYLEKSPENKMKYTVVVIDEFADFSMQGTRASKKDKKRQALQDIADRKFVEQAAKRYGAAGKKFAVGELISEDALDIDAIIVRLAQMARAVGIHLIIATQRPSVDVITGLIKANFPTKIALATSSHTDSEVILGESGAEKLGGKGDMIVIGPKGKVRLQGFMVQK